MKAEKSTFFKSFNKQLTLLLEQRLGTGSPTASPGVRNTGRALTLLLIASFALLQIQDVNAQLCVQVCDGGEVEGEESFCGPYNPFIIANVEEPDQGCNVVGPDCCDAGGDLAAITFTYTGEDCSAGNNSQDPGKVSCSGDPNSDPTVYIVSSDNDDGSGDIWFSGNVNLGETFTIAASNAGQDKFSSSTFLQIYSSAGGSLLQAIEFHTSCSQPISVNNQFGAVRIKGITFDDGTSCGEGTPPGGGGFDCCDSGDKPQTISLIYQGDGCEASSSTQDPGKVSCSGDPNDAATVYVVSSSSEGGGGDIWFSGSVALNDTFNISALNAGKDNFSSATFLQVFSSAGGALLQSLEFHTSCSQPLAIGNQFGSMEVSGILFNDGVVCGVSTGGGVPVTDCCDFGDKPQTINIIYTGEDCSATNSTQDPGKVSCSGDPNDDPMVYIVSSSSEGGGGDVWFSGMVALNDTFAISALNAGKSNFSSATFVSIYSGIGGSLLQSIEFHTSCSQPLGVGNQFGSLLIDGILFDDGVNCGTVGTGFVADCCDIGDKPQSIVLTYTGNDCSATVSTQDPDKVNCSGDPNNDPSVYIIASDDENNDGDVWFSGSVALGESFQISALNAGQDNFSSNTFVNIYAFNGGPLLQAIEFHTSCSQPLGVGNVFGSLEVENITFDDGATCGPPPGIEYQWISSTTGCPTSISQAIPGATGTEYDPDSIFVTTYYVRLSRGEGCDEWEGVSNCIIKEVLPPPPAEITVETDPLCVQFPVAFSATDAGAGAIYAWDFGPGATPATSAMQNPGAVSWTEAGPKTVTLTVTGPNGCEAEDEAIVDLVYCLSAIGDFAFNDNNENGIQDAGDSPLAGITVTLYDAADLTTPLASQVTGADGLYLFEDLDPALMYVVQFSQPDDLIFTTQGDGASAGNPTDSDPGEDGFTDPITLVPNTTDTSIDAGYVPGLASIGDFAFVDNNQNGIQDAGDTPLSGVIVTIYDATDLTTPISSQVTGADGMYLFSGLDPDLDYVIQFGTPDQYTYTTPGAGASAGDPNDSDADPLNNGFTDVISVDPGEINTTVDAGYTPVALIGDFVFLDTNMNGFQDGADTPVPGVTVLLYDANDLTTPIASDVTDGDGLYEFPGLDPDVDYVVQFVLPDGYDFTTPGPGASNGLPFDSDAGEDGFTDVIDLDPLEENTSVDAGVILIANLGDFAFVDNNENGIQDAGDDPLQGVTVNLYGSDDLLNPIATDVTDENGFYEFTNLDPNVDYVIEFSVPDGFEFTTQGPGASAGQPEDSDPDENGFTDVISVDPGETDNTIDAGYLPIVDAAIGDFTFVDNNGNGTQDGGDSPLEGVEVNLYDATDLTTPLATTISDENGFYEFTGLNADLDYVLEFASVPDFEFTTPGAGASAGDPDDSDPDDTGFTDVIDLDPGENDETIDAGYLPILDGSIGDFVFVDNNENGVQDAGDDPQPGVTVNLYTSDDLTTPIATDVTDANGEYLFPGLDPGLTYVVEFVLPDEFEFTTPGAGASAGNPDDSDAGTDGFTDEITLENGEFDSTIDAGLLPIPRASLGDFTFVDNNGNGVQDAGDTPLAGVTVTLYEEDDLTTPIAVDFTDAGGAYLFEDLLPGVSYVVQFDQPDGFLYTTPGAGASTGNPDDSDAGEDGFTDGVSLDPGEFDPTVDAGYVPEVLPGTIGDFAFIDNNENGIQDVSDTPLAGVTVNLYDATDLTTPIASDVTDNNGQYEFTNLDPDLDYVVEFELPDNLDYTTQGAGASAGIGNDSDPDENGFTDVIPLDPGETDNTIDAGFIDVTEGLIGDFTFIDQNCDGIQNGSDSPLPGVIVTIFDATDLVNAVAVDVTDGTGNYSFPGLNPTIDYVVNFSLPSGYIFAPLGAGANAGVPNDNDAGAAGNTGTILLAPGETDNTVDAGYCPVANLGDFTFVDNNEDGVQNAGDEPLSGVTVNLYNPGDLTTPIATDVTDGSGLYSFTNLDPNEDYVVEFVLPDGFSYTTQGVGAAAGIPNDSDPANTGFTNVISLNPGETDNTIDAGFIPEDQEGTIGDFTFIDQNCNGIQDAGDTPLQGVVVFLYEASNLADFIDVDVTDASGKYSFAGLNTDLDYVIKFNLPSGFSYAPLGAGASAGAGNDSDAGASGFTDAIALAPGQVNNTVDAGYCPVEEPASIGDFAFVDNNNNGVQDAGDDPLPGVTVNLYNADDLTTPIATDVTDGTGEYLFDGLDPNQDYVVEFVLPDGFDYTTPGAGASTGNPNDSDAEDGGFTDVISVDPGEENTSVDAGFIMMEEPTATLGNFTFIDQNCNGIQDAEDTPLAGVVVFLYDATDLVNELDIDVTDATGNYSFGDLDAAIDYVLKFELPTGYTYAPVGAGASAGNGSDSDAGLDGFTDVVALAPGDMNNTVDAGFCPEEDPASIGDFAFVDNNDNGVQDAGDDPLPGVVVNLYDSDDLTTPIATDVTDENGEYLFENLDPNQDYVVEFELPDGFTYTTPGAGASAGVPNDSDPTNTGFTDVIEVDPGENNTTVDAGFQPADEETATLGNFTFIDQNCNGIQDAGDSPLPGVIVFLYDATDLVNELDIDVTDAGGSYTFGNLDPALDYVIKFNLPAGYTYAPVGAGASAGNGNDSDAGIDGFTDVVALAPGDVNNTVDAGFCPEEDEPGSIGDFAFIDNNDNGVQDAGDDPLPGVVVNLYNADDLTTPIATDVTDENGEYLFENLDPNEDYVVEFELPDGFTYTTPGAGASTGDPNDSDPTNTGFTDVIDLAPGEENTTVDAGFQPVVEPGSIGDFAFIDNNDNGVQDAGDDPLPGVVVNLYDADDLTTPIATDVTDENGEYLFNNLDPNVDYVVEFVLPDGFTYTTPGAGASAGVPNDSDPTNTGFTDVIDLAPGEENTTVDAGFQPADEETATLGNFTFIDQNCNGIQDAGDSPLPGVIVFLYDATDLVNELDIDVTDAGGSYSFGDLDPALDYVIKFNLPAGYTYAPVGAGASAGNGNDSDAGIDGFTDVVALAPGDVNNTVDAGFCPDEEDPGSIGDFAFVDNNENGIQDAGDTPLPGIIVNLYDATDLTTPVATDVTDGTGMYLFSGLDTNIDYVVEFVLPDGFDYTTPGAGASAGIPNDSDPGNTGFTDVITLAPGENNTTVDGGFTVIDEVCPTPTGLMAMANLDGNSITVTWNEVPQAEEYKLRIRPAGTSAWTQTVYPAADVTTWTFTGLEACTDYEVKIRTECPGGDNSGYSEVIDVTTAGCVDEATLGDFAFIDVNCNGLQDGPDQPLAGVTVSLYVSSDLVNPVAVDVTDASGNYNFAGLDPVDSYVVQFSLPAGYEFTTTGAGASAGQPNDSDAGPGGFTNVIALGSGENDNTVDAGYCPVDDEPACIGDFAFIDNNENGIQDAGDEPLSGITVNLYDATNLVVVIATDVTDASGIYEFCELDPNINYVIQFVLPPDYTFSPEGPGASTGGPNDSDAGPGGFTDVIDVAPGEVNTTVDGGFIPVEELPACIGDFAFIDNNENGIQDAGDQPLSGIVVNLYDATNLLSSIASDVTDGSGNYEFCNLDPNINYVIQFILPPDFVFSPEGPGASTGGPTDSDAGPGGFTDVIDVAPGEVNTTVDAGFIPTGTDCPKPTGLTPVASADGSSVTITWNPSANVFEYKLRLRPAGTSAWTQTIFLPAGVTTHTFSGLEACSDYEIKIRAICPGDITEGYTEVVSFTTGGCDNECTATPGTLAIVEDPVCMVAGSANISAVEVTAPEVPAGFSVTYVLTAGPGLIVVDANATPDFTVVAPGLYTIHTLVYDANPGSPDYIDLGSLVGLSGFDILASISASGICAALDAAGAPVNVLAGTSPDCIDEPCVAPDGVVAVPTASGTSALITWNAVPGATGYDIQIRPAGMPMWLFLNVTDNSFTADNLLPCTNYEFRIRTKCPDGSNSEYTDINVFTTEGCDSEVCVPPTGLSVETIASGTMAIISWNPVPGAEAFSVRVRPMGSSAWAITVTTTDNSVVITGLDPCSEYQTKIRSACPDGNNTAYSDIVSFTTEGCEGGMCETPVVTGATSSPTGNSALITWTTSGTPDSFILEYKKKNTSSYITVGTTDPFYTLIPLQSCQTYYYRIKAICGDMESAYTPVDSFNTEGCDVDGCPAPMDIDVSTTVGSSSTTINWSAVSGAEQYRVRIRPAGTNAWTVTEYVSGTSYTINTLNTCAAYEVKIRTQCFGGQYSVYSDIVGFTTGGCGGVTCDNVTFGGEIMGNQSICGPYDPSMIVSIELPAGGTGTLEYLWLKSTTNVAFSYGSADWVEIPGATGAAYNPGPITETTYFIRCARRSGCDEYAGESNVVVKDVQVCSDVCEFPTMGYIEIAPDGTSAFFSWDPVTGAESYNVEYRVAGSSMWIMQNTATSSLMIFGLTPCTDYEIRLQTVCGPGSMSPFTPITTLNTQACVSPGACAAPSVTWVDNLTSESARLNWDEQTDAIKYKVQYRKVGTNVWTEENITEAFLNIGNLECNTEYEFRLMVRCPAGWTTFSAMSFFTTAACPAPRASENNADELVQERFLLYPNPASDFIMVNYIVDGEREVLVNMYDALGRLVFTSNYQFNTGMNTLNFKLDSYITGNYFLEVLDGDTKVAKQFIIQR